MARIVFELGIDAEPKDVLAALDSADGIKGWWTDDVSFDGGPGSTIRLGFAIAPMPFELRVDAAGEERVAWTSVGEFPPHWAGTEIVWTLTADEDDGTTVHFSHDGWQSDEGPLPPAAMTWGQLMVALKGYVETGTPRPLLRG